MVTSSSVLIMPIHNTCLPALLLLLSVLAVVLHIYKSEQLVLLMEERVACSGQRLWRAIRHGRIYCTLAAVAIRSCQAGGQYILRLGSAREVDHGCFRLEINPWTASWAWIWPGGGAYACADATPGMKEPEKGNSAVEGVTVGYGVLQTQLTGAVTVFCRQGKEEQAGHWCLTQHPPVLRPLDTGCRRR